MVTRKRQLDPAAGRTGPGGNVAAVLAVLGQDPGPGGLDESLRVAQELIEVLPIPVFFKSRDGRYLGANSAWEEFFGLSREAFLGKTVHDIYQQDPEAAAKHAAMDEELWRHPGS